jgi:2-polyprenyl-3-methyl-5-hydroxy-6-metoxy-1,4-benzoquinol methylase
MRNEHEQACKRVAALFSARWLRHYVSSKLRSDPVFPAAFELLKDSTGPILDVGCGVGLLAFYLRERGVDAPVVGLDTDARKIRQGAEAARRYRDIELIEHDVRQALPAFRGNVALLDVVHYLAPADQRILLTELAARVAPGALLMLRDAPREPTARFWMTYAGEVFAQTISWNIGTRLHFPTRESLNDALAAEEFTREERPAWGRTPFNNRLFVFRRRSAAAPGAG